ncbi:MAG: hypothetical protein NTX25_16555, partial [Proteobacteria bacterium]|nr:hypothetical protein [Pseudomonadota bacterium]
WFKGPGVRWSRWTLGIGGLLHGYVQGAALAGTSQSVFMMYVFGLGLMQVALAFGFGIFAARVAKASPDGFEGLENIVSSLGAGVTLTYLVKAFY